jgi:predicted PurR-regulated permease PerM
MDTKFIVMAYYIYLPVVAVLTWYVARTLFKNGRAFMNDIFHGNEVMAGSTSRLFELGFYLLNVGFAFTIMEITRHIKDYQGLLEELSLKLGGYSIYLGIMLFFNLYLFFRGRRISKMRKEQPVIQL